MSGGGGLIGAFARHPTAANLLMVAMIVVGLFALARLNTQFFPDFGIDVIAVTVEWPGASAEDVDANIAQAIEPEVRFLDGVKHVRSNSLEGVAAINIEFEPGTDMQAALSNVETAVDQVTTLPEDSEQPEIRRLVRYDTITRLVISGPYGERALKALAKDIRDDLLARGVDKVDLVGTRDEEIWVEVPPPAVRRYDLGLGDIARRIDAVSEDLPSGDTRGASEVQVRSLGLAKTAREVAKIALRARPDGQRLRVGDVARVSEHLEEGGVTVRSNGRPAVELDVRRAVTADALELAATVDDYLAELADTRPRDLEIGQYFVAANMIRDRIDLLLRNGLGGLVLVVAILFLFLNGRVAFWVAIGIPVSLTATLAVMWASGQSINMVSLFGLIMALGIVVDDAIVVGEHAEARRRAGMPPLEAAESGARRMAVPVLSSSLTTIAAFVPLFVISDIIGTIIAAIPSVVVAILIASLIECFLVLPGHLRGALAHEGPPRPARRWFDARFAAFRDGPFRRLVVLAVRWRYATLASAVGALVVVIGLVLGGRVGFVFFPSPEVDRIYANAELAPGSPRADTEAVLEAMVAAARRAEARLSETPLIHLAVAKVGTRVGPHGAGVNGDNVGGIVLELIPTDRREVTAVAFIEAWRREVVTPPGVEVLTIVPEQGGPPGREIDVRLSGREPARLKAAAEEVKGLLARYAGVSEIEDNLPFGKLETVVTVNERGHALGFTTEAVGRQLRDAFEGAIAKRFARGDEEVTVRVQYPRDVISPALLDDFYLRAPGGAEVALADVTDRRHTRGFASIRREDGTRQVAITAEVDKAITNSDKVRAALMRDGLADIAERHQVRASFSGKAEEQATTFADMRFGALIGLSAIYIILAWVFASYWRPLVVMSIIPVGVVGAVIGHLIMGYDLTILSMVALVGLSGIVVNDSIILVATIDERLRAGEPTHEAIVDGARDRLRAVVLTSATTIGGLTPLLFETSLQAQFLIPMAITLVFGLMATTVLVLVVVPALLAVQADIGTLYRRRPPAPAPTPRRAAE